MKEWKKIYKSSQSGPGPAGVVGEYQPLMAMTDGYQPTGDSTLAQLTQANTVSTPVPPSNPVMSGKKRPFNPMAAMNLGSQTRPEAN